jgi:hypothetical protein
MKTTLSSILVLSLCAARDTLTRKVLSTNAQKNLFREGIEWAEGGTEPAHLEAPYLIVEDGKLFHSNPADVVLHAILGGEMPKRFDINTEYDAFLQAVKQQKRELTENEDGRNLTIDGVRVKISEDKVEIDPTDLLASVANKAKEAQAAEFGR